MTEDPFEADTVGDDVVVTRSEEQLLVSTPWTPYRRYRIGKRIVTETRTVTVDVRHEELVYEDLGDPGLAEPADRNVLSDGPLEIVLHEEQVTVAVSAVPVSRYRFQIDRIYSPVVVEATLAQERLDMDR